MTEPGWVMAFRKRQNRTTADYLTTVQQDLRKAAVKPRPRPIARLHAGMLTRTGVGRRKQTVKLQPDALVTMLERGALKNVHLRAAAEIREIFEALTRHRGAKIMNGAPKSVPPKMLELYRSRYKPWADDAGQRRMIIPGGHMTHLEVVVSVIVEGESLIGMTERLKIPRLSGCSMFDNILRHSLARYCEIGAIG
ncbi:MAG: hypothetical protein ACTSX7_10885 [Alphaproteobacteria bacterium]